MEPFDLLVTLGHIDLFIDLGESYAADKTEKEDNIENTCNTIKEKSENKEEMNIEHEIKGDKINKEVTKTLKLNVKKDKTNKTMNKKKNETPRPELKSLVKRKIKPETAKLLEVNNYRKLTEFWLPSPDREKTSKFTKPVVEPAKQENKEKITLQALSDVRMGGGGKL